MFSLTLKLYPNIYIMYNIQDPAFTHQHYGLASLVAQMVKNPPAMQETWVPSLGGEYTLRRAWQPTPVFLPGASSWTEEPGRLQSMR